jgi:hypothetical protein
MNKFSSNEKSVIQEQHRNCPGIFFYKSLNKLEIIGRAIPENPELIFNKLNDWLSGYLKKNDGLNISIQLEYINSSSSKYLFETLKSIESERRGGKKIVIKWLFEEDDEAMKELGEHYRNTSGLPMVIEMIF